LELSSDERFALLEKAAESNRESVRKADVRLMTLEQEMRKLAEVFIY
jgi:hypothetical protein